MSQVERLTRLSEILAELFRSPIPSHFFQTLGDQAWAAVPCDYLAVCLQDPEKGGYLVHSQIDLEEGAMSRRVFSPDQGLPGRAISTGKAYIVEDLATEDGAPDLEGVLAASGLRAALVVPGSSDLGDSQQRIAADQKFPERTAKNYPRRSNARRLRWTGFLCQFLSALPAYL